MPSSARKFHFSHQSFQVVGFVGEGFVGKSFVGKGFVGKGFVGEGSTSGSRGLNRKK